MHDYICDENLMMVVTTSIHKFINGLKTSATLQFQDELWKVLKITQEPLSGFDFKALTLVAHRASKVAVHLALPHSKVALK